MGIKTILICDKPNCENQLELEGPYHIAKDEIKEEGWTNRKVGDEWHITCPECNGKKYR